MEEHKVNGIETEYHFELMSKKISRMRRYVCTALSRTMQRGFIQHMDIRLVDHCNLNCKCCSVCSPIAGERFADPKSIERDLLRLHELVGDKVMQIHLLGGEPLLHPRAEEFASIARKAFPFARIDFTTNGLLVKQMPETFWECLREYDVALKYTRYPISIDYDELTQYVSQKGIFVFTAGGREPINSFRRIPLNTRGTANPWESYLRCAYVDCSQLRDGKLWHCPFAANHEILNRAMKKSGLPGQFRVTPLDYVDLYQASDGDAVLDFMSGAIPFCQYCELNLGRDIPWEISGRSIFEWIDT